MNARRHLRGPRFFFAIVAMLLLSTIPLAGGSAQTDGSLAANGYLNAIQGGSTTGLISPHAMLRTPEGAFAGIDGLARFGAKLDASFDDIVFAPDDTRSVGDYLIIEFTFSASHTGSYHGAAADCARISVPGVAVMEVTAEGITQQWISYDQQTVLDQIHVYSLSPENERASCDSSPVVAEPVPGAGPPSCPKIRVCSLPY